MLTETSVAENEWMVDLPTDNPRRALLMQEISPAQLIAQVVSEVVEEAAAQGISGMLEASHANAVGKPIYRRYSATIKLKESTFDSLMNGRSGYRAQFYIGLDAGRSFNRALLDGLIPTLEAGWNDPSEPWQFASRSLNDETAKIWAAQDRSALRNQPKLKALMWETNCDETGACKIGLHLFSTKPSDIVIKGGWLSNQAGEWTPDGKRCRDELLRCFGFT